MSQDWIALGLALLGPLVLIGACRAMKVPTLRWSIRTALWLIAAGVFWLMTQDMGLASTLALIGARPIDGSTLINAAVLTGAVLAGGGLTVLIQMGLKVRTGDRETFAEVASASLGLRTFTVITASVVEEFLYRGVGIGLGLVVFQSPAAAVALATAAFVAAHLRWKASHLIQVGVLGTIFGVAFLVTRDLWACVIAHFVVDFIGFIVTPTVMKRRAAAPTASASN